MKQNKIEIIDKVKQWIKLAKDDINLAEFGLTMKSSCPYKLLAFHAQQCIEKYLKAYLVYNEIDFPFTHNLGVLIDLYINIDKKFLNLKEAETLTRYGIITRYPSFDREINKEEAIKCVNIAKDIQNFILKLFNELI